MSLHIPTNQGEGVWESVEIPFKVLIGDSLCFQSKAIDQIVRLWQQVFGSL
jgi:hypothetical protein